MYGNQRQSQGPYRANLNEDHDPRVGTSNKGLPFNTGASPAANPLSSLPLFSQMSYRTEPDQTMDLQLSRDEPRHLNNPLSQPSSQMTPQRDDLHYPFTYTSSYSGSSSSAARPPPTASNCDSSIDESLSWLRDITRSTSAEPRSSFPSSSSSFQGGGDASPNFRGSSDSQLKRSEGAIPGLGDYPIMENPHQRNDPPITMYGAETAANILRHFNLEKEDLEQLLAIPEEEITPDNLPHILRKIRMEKIRKAAAPSTSYKDPSSARPSFNSSSWADSKESKVRDYGHKDLSGTAKNVSLPKQGITIKEYSKDIPPIPNKVDLEKDKPPVLQNSKVIEYGHTGTCITGAGTESGTVGAIARAIQGITKVNTPSTRESFLSTVTATTPPSPPKPIPSLVSTSHGKKISPTTSFSSLFHSTFTPTGSESSKKSLQGPTVVKSFSVQKQVTDNRQQFIKLPPQSKQATKKSGLIIVDSCMKPKSKNVDKKLQWPAAPQTNPGPLPIKSCKKSRFDMTYVSSILTIPSSNVPEHPTVVPVAPIQTSNMGNLLPLTPALTIPSSNVMWHPTVVPVAPIQTSNMGNQLPLTPASTLQSQTQDEGMKRMIQDYTAACPSSFPHTCSLCYTECSHMKDWISHQKSPVHFQNYTTRLKRRSRSRSSSPRSQNNSEQRDKSRSRSGSPRRHRKKERKRSRSASPPSSSRQPRSHSRSRERHRSSPRRPDNKQTSPKRKDEHKSSPRSRSASPPSSSCRRESSPHRRGDTQTSPKRKDEQRSPRSHSASPPSSSRRPRSRSKSLERLESSPRQAVEHCRDNKRTSPKRKNESRLVSPPSSRRPRSRSRSRERRESSPRRVEQRRRDDKRKSPQRKDESRLVSPPSFSRRPRSRSRSRERRKRTPPKTRDELRQFPRSKDDRCLSPFRNDFRQRTRTSPRRNRERRYSPDRYSPSRYTPPSRSPSRSSLTPPRGHDQWERDERDERSLSRSTRESRSSSNKRSTDKTSGERKKQSELEKATKKILDKTSVLTALSSSADMDSLVETMMPLLLSRLAKEMGTSAAPSTTTKKKVVKKMVSKPTAVKSSTMVRLGSIIPLLSHDDVVAFAEQFGKTKSVLLFRQKHQAVVCFEKEEDAKKLRKATDLQIKGHSVTIVKFKEAFSMIQTKSAVKRPLKSAAKMTTGKTSASETTPGEATTSKATTKKAAPSIIKLDTVTPKGPTEVEPVTAQLMKEEPAPLKPIPSPRSGVESVGETLDKLLTLNSIKSKVVCHSNINHKFLEEDRKWLVLLTDLPEYDSMQPYSEEELVDRLKPFQFQDEPNNLYVLPQCRMAFVTMPNSEATRKLVMNYQKESDTQTNFRGPAFVLKQGLSIYETPFCFYVSLMILCNYKCEDDGERTVFITNISDSDVAELRKRLKKIGSVKNFVPLLNKVFVEFKTSRDADRLGVYHSLLNTAPSYELTRMKVPSSKGFTWPPLLAANAMPDASESVPGVVVPAANLGIPIGSGSSFWVTLNSRPFMFPTQSPWFIIPDFDTAKLQSLDNNRTVMLTGLPVDGYTLLQVFGLTLPYGHSHCMHYHIIVLPLQRRAFINFLTAEAYEGFVQRSFRISPVLKGEVLKLYNVNCKLFPVSTEEEVYTTFMKLSNNRAPEKHQLDQRLLSVFVSEVSLTLIRLVMEFVTSVAPILGFLPLANRVCIEMSDVSDVAKVKEKFSSYKPEPASEKLLWSKVLSLETSNELKDRLKKSGKTVVCLSQSPVPVLSEKSDQVEGESSKAQPNITLKDIEMASEEKEEKAESEGTTATHKAGQQTAKLVPEKTETKDTEQNECQTSGDFAAECVSSDSSDFVMVKDISDKGDLDAVIPEPMEEKAESGSKPDPTIEMPDLRSPSLSIEPGGAYLTVGETLDKLLTFNTFKHRVLGLTNVFKQKFLKNDRKMVVLCNLPEYDPLNPYTEEELVKKLVPFGFLNDPNDIYIIPQCRMAFVYMPNSQAIVELAKVFVRRAQPKAMFRDCQLKPHVFDRACIKEPWSFYCWLMQMCQNKRDKNGDRTVFISNINSDLAEFRKKLEMFGLITNYLPLLNKVFVEYETNADADRLGVYHSLLNKTPSYELTRMVHPAVKHEPQPPSVLTAMPDASDRAPGVTLPQMSCGIPLESRSPFWVTLSFRSFIYPTDSPWFHIPAFKTLPMRRDSWESFHEDDKTTIMLTNLPSMAYTQESVAKLVWPYLQGRNLHCFYYDIIVLPLQKRAFVNLHTGKCAQFAEKFFNHGLKLETSCLTFIQPHYILHNLFPLLSEKDMYTTFMELSNNRAPEKHQLELRLLCILVKKISFSMINLVMEVVASAAPILGFLPLANRICVELPKVSDVAKVKEKFSSYTPKGKKEQQIWQRVLSLETAAELKERVKRAGDHIVGLKIPFGPNAQDSAPNYHIYLGRDEPKDRERSSSSSDRYHTSPSGSSRESREHYSSTSSSSRLSNPSCSRSSSSVKPSECSFSREKYSEKSEHSSWDKVEESDAGKACHEWSDKCSSKTQEDEAESSQSSKFVELSEKNVQDIKDSDKNAEDFGGEGKFIGTVEDQKDLNQTTEDGRQFSESCQTLESVVKATKSGEKEVDLDESVQVVDRVTEVQNKQDSIDEKLSQEVLNQEKDSSQSESLTENMENLKSETKRKREEDISETQEIYSKTAKTDDQEGSEQETVEIMASSEDQITPAVVQKDENVPNDGKLVEEFKVVDDDIESEMSEATSTRSTRSGCSTRSKKGKTETKAKQESNVSTTEEQMVEFKVVDLEREEPKKDKNLTRRRSTRGKKEPSDEILDSIEDSSSKKDVSTRLTRGRMSVKTDSSLNEKSHNESSQSVEDSPKRPKGKTSKDLKESATGLEQGASKRGKTSSSDSLKNQNTTSQSVETPVRESHEAKMESCEEMDSVEKVQTRSLRQTRSSQRDDSSDSPLTRNTPTRHGRTTTRETKQEKSAMTDSPKVDIQEVKKQEIVIQDAVEKEPVSPPNPRRGRMRKQPQQTAAKVEEKDRTPAKEEGDIQESGNEKPYEQAVSIEISEENAPKKVEEEDEPFHEVLDLLKGNQIQDDQMSSIREATETVMKIDQSLREDALAEGKLLFEEEKPMGNAGQIQEKAVELKKEMIESVERASATALVERETSESFDETAKQTAMDVQKQSGNLRDQATEETEVIREAAFLEAKKMEKQTIRATRLTRSGKVYLSEEISPKRASRRNETKQQSKSELPTENDDKGLFKTCEIEKMKSVKDEAVRKKEENSPQVASKQRGRARKQPRKSASKSVQSTEEWQESNIEQDKMDNVLEKQEIEIVLEEMPKNEDDIHEVVDLVEKDQGLGEECSDVISKTLEKCEDGQLSEERKNASEISEEEDTIEKEGVEEAKGVTEFKQGHSENVEWLEQNLEAPEATGNSDLEKSKKDVIEKRNTEGPKPLENQTTSENMAATTTDTKLKSDIPRDTVVLETVNDEAKFPDTKENEQRVGLRTEEEEPKLKKEPKEASAPEPQPENLQTPDEEEAAAVEATSETSKSDKQKHEEGTEVPGFVVGDRVGDVEEEETRGRGRKSPRKIYVGSKRRTDVEGPDLKRPRSLSPSVPCDTKLPPFRPNNPLGQEYVVPKTGFFCDLCSVFYLNETTAREQHCSSRRHYDNLKKHLERQSQGAT